MSRLTVADEPFTIIDGGLSTALGELGETAVGPLWTAAALVDRPDIIVRAHRQFVDAGADIIISSSYQASEDGFRRAGLSAADARRTLAATTHVARQSGARRVACSIGPYGACLADGSEYHGRYEASWDEVATFHRRRFDVLVGTGPDMYAIETIPTLREAMIIVEALRDRTDAPAWVTFSCADAIATCGGDVAVDALGEVARFVDGVGVNCTAPGDCLALMADAGELAGVCRVAYPNRGGRWSPVDGEWHGSDSSTDLIAMATAGVELVGGCCGIGSHDIAALANFRASLVNRPAT